MAGGMKQRILEHDDGAACRRSLVVDDHWDPGVVGGEVNVASPASSVRGIAMCEAYAPCGHGTRPRPLEDRGTAWTGRHRQERIAVEAAERTLSDRPDEAET